MSGFVYRPSYCMYVGTIPLSGYMDRNSRQKCHMIKMMKVDIQQNVMQHVNLQQTNQNTENSKHKYYCHIECI